MFTGIDPGEKGAIAVINGRHIEFLATQDVEYLSPSALENVTVERQVALPRQKGAGKTMYEFGRLIGYLTAKGANITIVAPSQWYKFYKIHSGMEYRKRKMKTASIIGELYPEYKDRLYGPRGGLLDGRSDALAIAHWAKCQQATFSESP